MSSRRSIAGPLAGYLLVQHITLVSNEDAVDAFAGVLLNVSDPVSNVYRSACVCDETTERQAGRQRTVEGSLVGHIVDQ